MWLWILIGFYAGVLFGIIIAALELAIENEDDPYP